MLKLPMDAIKSVRESRDWGNYCLGYGMPYTSTTLTCEFKMSLISPSMPSVGEEIAIEDVRYRIINIIVSTPPAGYYNNIKLECVPAGPAYPEFVYNAEELVRGLKEIFRKMKYA